MTSYKGISLGVNNSKVVEKKEKKRERLTERTRERGRENGKSKARFRNTYTVILVHCDNRIKTMLGNFIYDKNPLQFRFMQHNFGISAEKCDPLNNYIFLIKLLFLCCHRYYR